ncbi:hypothetical protein SLA2020_366870 [Shorea laevis]
MDIHSSMVIIPYLLFFFFKASFGVDSITSTQSLSDGKTLVSREGSFELGFFSPGSSKNRYLGIWYKNIPVTTVVWVANRLSPINGSSGILMINNAGSLLLLNQNKTVVWSTNGENTNPEDYLWQSFDYPSDTLLPGMKHGWDLRRRLNRRLTHGKTGMIRLLETLVLRWNFIITRKQLCGKAQRNTVARALGMAFDYHLQRWIWIEAEKIWKLYASLPKDRCDEYNVCGAYGSCILSESPVCQCLKGFKPESQEKWESMDWTQGCVRNKPLSCQEKHKHGFLKFFGLKLPDTTYSWVNKSMNLKECRVKCLNNCSCMAYTNSNITGVGSGCALWFGDLLDIRKFDKGGQDLYIRMHASELEKGYGPKKKIAVIVVASLAVVSGMVLVSYLIRRSRKNLKEETKKSGIMGQNNEGQGEDMELPVLDVSTIARATNDFSPNNKLGEGGFGPVYMGILVDGQKIAVKRLSRISGQGLNEFKNEVILIAKLQHRNLVRLLGCCIEGEEKMLVYEYMPNKSLDYFIFEQTRCEVLDWPRRFQIICGIARGLLYLHQDSRLRIVHRDLKASNILLDSEMNPKISDFGMAKTFRGDQTEGNTNRVVGTYGYMAPEYAFDGLFSTKSDIFSFGILLLEIVSGKKSRGLYHQDLNLNLIGYAWRLWKEGRPLELVDACLGESHSLSEVLRCIHVSLLCVQQRAEDRPSMSSVVLMLSSESALPQPKETGAF